MARPKIKAELLEQSAKNYEKLISTIEKMDASAREADFPKGTLNRNIRDVLAHLHHWHLLMLNWYKIGMKGDNPEMPASGYSWKTTPELNIAINEKYKGFTLKEIRKLFASSHSKLQKLIQSHTDEELFTKKKYKWTGSTSLGAYLVSSTSSHYDWALKLIKKSRK